MSDEEKEYELTELESVRVRLIATEDQLERRSQEVHELKKRLEHADSELSEKLIENKTLRELLVDIFRVD